jgi:hypothetical protein
MIGGRPSGAALDFFSGPGVRRVGDPDALAALLDAELPRHVDLRDGNGAAVRDVWALLTDRGDSSVLFLTNRNAVRPFPVEIRVARDGRVEEWFPWTDASVPIPLSGLRVLRYSARRSALRLPPLRVRRARAQTRP